MCVHVCITISGHVCVFVSMFVNVCGCLCAGIPSLRLPPVLSCVNLALHSLNALVCMCLCVCVFRIVYMDKILCFTNTLIIVTYLRA